MATPNLKMMSRQMQPQQATMTSTDEVTHIHQAVAFYHLFRQSLVTLSSLPLLALVLPPCLYIAIALLDFVTRGMAEVSILLMVTFIVTGYALIHKLSSTKEKAEQAYQINEYFLPITAVISSIVLSREIIARIVNLLPFDFFFWRHWYYDPFPKVGLALALVLLGLQIVARYFGPQSVMRCSSVPLYCNPLDASIRAFLKNPLSIAMMNNSNEKLHYVGKRFQRISVRLFLVQFVIQMTVAFGVYTCLRESTSAPFFLVHFVAVSSHFCLKALTGHEIHPEQYLQSRGIISLTKALNLLKESVFLTGGVTLVTLSASLWMDSYVWYGLNYASVMQVASRAFLIIAYCTFVEESLLSSFFYLPDPLSLVEALGHSRFPASVEMFLRSFVPDEEIYKQMQQPVKSRGINRMEEQETLHALKLMQNFATWFVAKPRPTHREAPFEEDIIRVLFLHAILQSDKDITHHERSGSAKYWIEVSLRQQVVEKPMISVILQALSIYCGALGKALDFCASRQQAGKWFIAPTTFVCCELALAGMTRIFTSVLDLDNRRPGAEWLQSHLSIQMSIAISAVFQLHEGLSVFTGRYETSAIGPKDAAATQHPEISSIHTACETFVRRTMNHKNFREQEMLALDHKVREWTSHVLANTL